jgi:hypothetical protein
MTAKQYNTQVNKLFKSKGLTKGDSHYQLEITTIFGILHLSTEYIPRIKIASIHSKLYGNRLGFKEWLGSSIDTYNGKYNLYFEDPESCLDELTELIDNIEYLNINGLPKA